MATTLTPILKTVLSEAASALSAEGVPAGHVSVAPGASVAFDNCCEAEGQLWVRVISTAPYEGDSNASGRACDTLLASILGMGVVRCAHTLDDHGVAPTPEQLTSDAEFTLLDQAVLLQVLTCRVPELAGVLKAQVDSWSPQGPLGGCVGGEWRFSVLWDPCLC